MSRLVTHSFLSSHQALTDESLRPYTAHHAPTRTPHPHPRQIQTQKQTRTLSRRAHTPSLNLTRARIHDRVLSLGRQVRAMGRGRVVRGSGAAVVVAGVRRAG
jgi:hypothetical protein